jgi:hypothetical protein
MGRDHFAKLYEGTYDMNIQSFSTILLYAFYAFPASKELSLLLLMNGARKGARYQYLPSVVHDPLLQSVVLTTVALLLIIDLVEARAGMLFRFRPDTSWIWSVQIEKIKGENK